MTRYYAIIVAGGQGLRMGKETPKQFLDLNGKPILRHTVEKFQKLSFPVEIITVLPSAHKVFWKNYCEETGFLERYVLVSGGITRFHSVQNALRYVTEDDAVVAVHDGVRPFVSSKFLESLFRSAEKDRAVVPVLPPVESIRRILPDGSSEAVDRSGYALVQTPQVFTADVLKKAYALAYNPAFTDDASVVEAAGFDVKLVKGERFNVKLTTPEDMVTASAICSFLSGC